MFYLYHHPLLLQFSQSVQPRKEIVPRQYIQVMPEGVSKEKAEK